MSDSTIAIRPAPCRVFLTMIWFTCVILGSLLPSWKILFHTSGNLHLPVHFAVFAFSGFLVFGFASPLGQRRVFYPMALIGLGSVLEALQRAIFRNSFEWQDFVTDSVGVLVALFFMTIPHSRRISMHGARVANTM